MYTHTFNSIASEKLKTIILYSIICISSKQSVRSIAIALQDYIHHNKIILCCTQATKKRRKTIKLP